MIDAVAAIREILLADSALVAKVSDRVYSLRLPERHNFDNQAVVYSIRGGSTDLYVPFIRPSIQIQAWGKDSVAAQEIYRLVHDALHDKSRISVASGFLVFAFAEVLGQTLIDPDSKRPFVLAFFRAIFRKD